jgi:phosphoglucosamine mutase
VTLKFGTDGVRGVANSELTPELALALGRASARVLGGDRWLVGRDTRRSGPMLAAALAAGLASEGVEVIDLGVLPTPGVAFLAGSEQVPAAMISASHNPFADNGIKLFATGGRKLTDQVEEAVETELALLSSPVEALSRREGINVGTIDADPAAVARYRDHLVHTVLDGRSLAGLRVVIDAANGAASAFAADVLQGVGATVVVIHDQPNGTNINDRCGATHTESLQAAVLAEGADVGLALDGDADRALAVDAAGQPVDGDHLIGLCAIDLHTRGRLTGDAVAVTVMSNLGFHQGMAAHGIRVVTTDVGDRYVLEAIDAGGLALGGEQSGHVIFRHLAATGDGLLTGLCVLDAMVRAGRPLAELAADAMTQLPQVLINVRLDRRRPELMAELEPDVVTAEAALGERGRVLLRPSGTEPLIRVMVEAPSSEEASEVAERLARAVRERAG